MKTRTIQEIESAFREMGLTEDTWGRTGPPGAEVKEEESSATPQVFVRIEVTTTPLEEKPNAYLA